MTHITHTTKSVSNENIIRNWHLVDLNGKILGREVSKISQLLQGKQKRNYVPYLDMGDFVVIVNASKVKLTGGKEMTKEYDTYSGHPGGRKVKLFHNLIKENPEKVIRFAVTGMLPKNKHRDPRLARLFVFEGAEHPYEDKFVPHSSPRSKISN